jgi:hypothetical protein
MSLNMLGFCPEDTVIEVYEKRTIKIEGEYTTRLLIRYPEEWVGWVSEKNHILTAIPSENAASVSSSVVKVDPELQLELNRRAAIRKQRQALKEVKSSLSSMRKASPYPQRKAKIYGSINVSADTFFLLNGANKEGGVTISNDCRTVTCDGRSTGRVLVLGSRYFTRGDK